MTQFMLMSFKGKPWNAPEGECNHGWDGNKFWLDPRGKCVKCGERIRCCQYDYNNDGNCHIHKKP